MTREGAGWAGLQGSLPFLTVEASPSKCSERGPLTRQADTSLKELQRRREKEGGGEGGREEREREHVHAPEHVRVPCHHPQSTAPRAPCTASRGSTPACHVRLAGGRWRGREEEMSSLMTDSSPSRAGSSKGCSSSPSWLLTDPKRRVLCWVSSFTSLGSTLLIHKMGTMAPTPLGCGEGDRRKSMDMRPPAPSRLSALSLPSRPGPLWRQKGTPVLRQKWRPVATCGRDRSLAEAMARGPV